MIVENIIPRNVLINRGAASVDNHIPWDDIFAASVDNRVPCYDIFDYHPLRECNICALVANHIPRDDIYTPRKLCLWWVYCFHVVRACVRVSVRVCVRP